MRKRGYRTIVLVMMSLLLCGCGAQKKDTDASEIQIEEKEETQEIKKEETQKTKEDPGEVVGIVFPDKDDKVLRAEAQKIKKELEEKEYSVKLVYAGNDGKKQAEQIKQMVKDKVSGLVICPVNSGDLKDSLKQAKKQGILVISYDKLIANTEDLSYYVGFDYNEIGKEAAEYFVKEKKLDSAKKEKKSYTIEFFMGALDDMNGRIQMDAMMNILDPYFALGVLQCKSLRTTYEDVSIAKGSKEIAGKTCDNIMKANYMDKPVNLIYVGNDNMVEDVVSALKEQSGFEKSWPVIASSGSDEAVFQRLKEKTQVLSVYQMRETLPQLCVDLVDQSMQGKEIKNLGTVNNGTAKIAAVFGKIKTANQSNYQQVENQIK
ncbi:MAG: substrate-binding domain-containing protein [Eubacteriales bacterium]|nr:substrate-binding domain-containing protein [Eubacteriales bacterium]